MGYRTSSFVPRGTGWGSEENIDPYDQRKSGALAAVALQLAQARSSAIRTAEHRYTSAVSIEPSFSTANNGNVVPLVEPPLLPHQDYVSTATSSASSILLKRSFDDLETYSDATEPNSNLFNPPDSEKAVTLLSPSKVKKVPAGYIQKRASLVNEHISKSSLEWKRRAALMNRYEEWFRTAKPFRSSSVPPSDTPKHYENPSSSSSSSSMNEDISSSTDALSSPTTDDTYYTTYFRQADAFHSIDQLYLQQPSSSSTFNYKVFSLETNSSGKRKFIVARIDTFWSRYAQSKVRHYYEILREDTPVHLYFDIEYHKQVKVKSPNEDNDASIVQEINQHVDGDKVLGYFMYRVAKALHRQYGISITWDNIVHLESSTDQKFSRHIIVRLPNGARFRDTAHAGEFVMQIVEDCSNDLHRKQEYRQRMSNDTSISIDNSILSDDEEELVHSLWIETIKNGPILNAPYVPASAIHQAPGTALNSVAIDQIADFDWDTLTEEDWLRFEQGLPLATTNNHTPTERSTPNVSSSSSSSPASPSSSNIQREFIVDLGVYTKNRAMRMYMSSKFDKEIYLLPAGSNRYKLDKRKTKDDTHNVTDNESQDPTLSIDYWLNGTNIVTPEELRTMDDSAAHYGLLLQHSQSNDVRSPFIQIGNNEWEERMWKASLITDGLPPLNFSYEDTKEILSSPRTGKTCKRSTNFSPTTHPSLGFSLLYCWPRTNKNEETVLLSPSRTESDNQGCLSEYRPLASRSGRFKDNGITPRYGVRNRSPDGATNKFGTHPKALSAFDNRLPPPRIVEGGTNVPPFRELTEWIKTIASGPILPSNDGTLPKPILIPSTARSTKGTEYFSTKEMTMEELTTQRIPATIRSWSMKVRDLTYKVPTNKTSSLSSGPPYEYIKYPIIASVTYQINGSRYCHRIQRHHRSNNVYWIVNLETGTAVQSCFDYECRTYRSVPLPIPIELLPNQGPIDGILQLEDNRKE